MQTAEQNMKSVSDSAYHYNDEKLALEAQQIKAAQKDPKAFAPLYEAYFMRIYRYVWQRVTDDAIAGDITSQVFAKALQKLPDYKYQGVPLGAWLFRVAQNELNQLFRSRKNKRSIAVDTEQLGHLFVADEEETSYTFSDNQKQDLIEAIRELKPAEIELIELRFFEQRSFKEIGDILELTENNAKVKTFRVVKKLRGLLLDE